MRHILTLLVLIGLAPASLSRADEPGRKYLLERVDDVAVVQLYADGFKDLPLKRKLLTWHLYQASIAGRDIYYDQRHAWSLRMRQILETIVSYPEGIDPAALAEIHRYTKLFWINSGPYNNLTARKFVLKCSPESLLKAWRTAVTNWSVHDKAIYMVPENLHPTFTKMFFDPNFDSIVTNKSPGPGKDILASSANNLYVNVMLSDLVGFKERFGLNSRLGKVDGRLVEEVYKIGGLYDKEIREIVHHLTEGKMYADPPTAKALDALLNFYTTGKEEDRIAYDIAWVNDKDAQVDTINGFIEVYMDPRGVKAGWESAVFYVNNEKTGNIKKLAAEAQWFEDHMPWIEAFRKPNVKGITANAIDVVIETGDLGPVTPIGINLPNDQKVRENHGSKSVSLSNVLEASDKATPTSFRQEFAWTEDEAKRAAKWGTIAQELFVNMHEVIGHASGRQKEGFQGQPQDTIKEYFSALEEGRADLVALYFMLDPKLAELGLIAADQQAEMAQAAYEQYARNALVQLRRVKEGSQIEEDHMRNRQMVVKWLITNTKAVEVRRREDKTFYVMTDPKAFREGVGKLLAEVQRVKSEGDFDGSKALFETYGIHFDPKLRDEVLSRVAKLDLPSYTGYVMPKLTPLKDVNGKILDITISYPMNLTEQMLEYSHTGR